MSFSEVFCTHGNYWINTHGIIELKYRFFNLLLKSGRAGAWLLGMSGIFPAPLKPLVKCNEFLIIRLYLKITQETNAPFSLKITKFNKIVRLLQIMTVY